MRSTLTDAAQKFARLQSDAQEPEQQVCIWFPILRHGHLISKHFQTHFASGPQTGPQFAPQWVRG